MDSINLLIAFCTILPIVYVSGFVHVLGHALVGHAVGFSMTSFGMGVGHPIAVFSRGRTRIYFCRTKPLQGIAFGIPPVIFPPRRLMVPYLAGGIIANALLAIFALALYRWLPWGKNVWHTACFLNAFLAIANLVPFSIRIGKAALRTDGGQVLQVLRDRVISIPAPQTVQTLKVFRPLWESINSHAMLRVYILGAAAAYSEMEDFERAESTLAELDSLDPSDLPTVQAREALIRSVIAAGAVRLEEAAETLDRAEAMFQALGDEGGLLYTAMQRSWIRALRHESADVLDELSSLTSRRLVRRGTWFQSYVNAFCVQVHAAGSNAVGAEQSLVAYEATRRKHPSAWRDLRVYGAVAGLRAQDHDWERAETAYRRAIEAIDQLAGSWPDAEVQNRFMERQRVFLDQAYHCYQSLNRAQEAERLIAPQLSPERTQQRLDDERRRHDRQRVRAGRWLIVIDAVCVVGSIVVRATFDLKPGHPFFSASTLFALFTFVAVVFFVPYLAIGWIVPRVRDRGAVMMLILAAVPWLAALIFLFSSLF
jgi:tetratricopeptide (TPR) repeat protein